VTGAACSSSGSSTSSNTEAPAPSPPRTVLTPPKTQNAARLTTCTKNAHGSVVVGGTVLNTGDTTATLGVHFTVRGPEGRTKLATTVRARSVKPGKVARWKKVTRTRYQKGMQCRVTSVSRDS